jgi:hypothetical protein
MAEQHGPPVNPGWSPVWHDGHRAWITGIGDEDGATVVDLIYASGLHKWCYWPSHRIVKREDDE